MEGVRHLAELGSVCFAALPPPPVIVARINARTGIVRDVEGVRHLAELGVVFLLFNIGLELSLERLRSMQKFVFGLGGLQVRRPVLLNPVRCHAREAWWLSLEKLPKSPIC